MIVIDREWQVATAYLAAFERLCGLHLLSRRTVSEFDEVVPIAEPACVVRLLASSDGAAPPNRHAPGSPAAIADVSVLLLLVVVGPTEPLGNMLTPAPINDTSLTPVSRVEHGQEARPSQSAVADQAVAARM